MKIRILLALLLWLPCGPALATPKTSGATSPDGKVVVQIDLPPSQRIKNIGSKLDGAGMCVFSSCEMAMRWGNLEPWRSWRDWCASNYTGGGWPARVDQLLGAYSKAKGIPLLEYIQYEGRDPAMLIAALKSGRMPSVTYSGRDDFYSGSVAHMTNLACYTGDDDSKDWVAVLDNNHPVSKDGGDSYVWMRPSEFKSRWMGNGSGWAVFFLAPPPPPIPVNALPAEPAPAVGEPFRGARYVWRWHPQHPNHVYLQTEGDLKVVGEYYWETRRFRFYDHERGRWLARCEPPFTPPRTPPQGDHILHSVTLDTVTDYGLPLAMFPYRGPGEERITRNGEVISNKEALDCLRGRPKKPDPQPKPDPGPKRPLPDDGAWLRLTVVGPEGLQKQVQTDLGAAPDLAPWKGRLVVQTYPPGHWTLAVGIRDGLTVQAPPDALGRGKVLHFQADYAGPKDLAAALRRADPLYDPKRDPDLRKTPAPLDGSPTPLAIPLLLLAALGGLLLLPSHTPPAPPSPAKEPFQWIPQP